MFGEPTEELVAATTEMGATVYSTFQRMSRGSRMDAGELLTLLRVVARAVDFPGGSVG